MSKPYYVYICASRRNGTISVGMTNDICRRAWEHREGLIPGFTKKYGVKMVVYDEQFSGVGFAIHRETRLKKWKRQWKINLIQEHNPEWHDLHEALNA
jgi:putative endonuclease